MACSIKATTTVLCQLSVEVVSLDGRFLGYREHPSFRGSGS